jgi:chemotaxis protein CheY-P-specific phosphatase CheC
MDITLDEFQKDILIEVASVAAGKVLKPMMAITGQNVVIAPPEFIHNRIEHITDAMGRPDEVKTIVYSEITGQARGAMVLLLNPKDVSNILPSVADELKTSTLEEITNMLTGSALGALSRMLNTLFMQGIPVSTTDMLRAVVTQIATDVGARDSQVLCLKIDLEIGESKIQAALYMLFDTETTAKILEAANGMIGK